MSPSLDFKRTSLRYTEDGHVLDIPVEYVRFSPDLLDIEANNLDVWDVPEGVPIAYDRRDAIVAWVRQQLDAYGTMYTLHEDEYLRRRAAPYQVRLGGTPDTPVLTYTRAGRSVAFPRGTNAAGRIVIYTSVVRSWSDPASAPLTDAERASIQVDIVQSHPGLLFA